MNWREFWNGDHAIYVNNRHKKLHNDHICKDLTALITKDERVLDFGCGEALNAGELARHCDLTLCDGAPTIVNRLKTDFKAILPEELNGLAEHSFDKIFVVSVLQYLSLDELSLRLADFKRLLSPNGSLYLADLLSPDITIFQDVGSLLSYGYRGGFLLAALKGLVVTTFSPYVKLRKNLGLQHFSEDEIIDILHKAGFKAERVSKNIGPHPHRFTVRAYL